MQKRVAFPMDDCASGGAKVEGSQQNVSRFSQSSPQIRTCRCAPPKPQITSDYGICARDQASTLVLLSVDRWYRNSSKVGLKSSMATHGWDRGTPEG